MTPNHTHNGRCMPSQPVTIYIWAVPFLFEKCVQLSVLVSAPDIDDKNTKNRYCTVLILILIFFRRRLKETQVMRIFVRQLYVSASMSDCNYACLFRSGPTFPIWVCSNSVDCDNSEGASASTSWSGTSTEPVQVLCSVCIYRHI